MVSCYLVANMLSIVYTVWEFAHFESLFGTGPFFALARDSINILYVIVGLVRLPIYVWCNLKFRQEIRLISSVRCVSFCTHGQLKSLRHAIANRALGDRFILAQAVSQMII